MYVPKLQHHLIITLLLVGLSPPLIAQDSDQPDWTETKDKWGQLLFCQRIYTIPDIKSRLYGFDIEQCDKAEQLIASIVAKHPQQDQQKLRYQAEQHAVRLSRNTSEPYHSVPACREYCGKLAEIQDKRSD